MKQARRHAASITHLGIAVSIVAVLASGTVRAADCASATESVEGLNRAKAQTFVRNKTDDYQAYASVGPVGRRPDPTYKTLGPATGFEKIYDLKTPEDSMDIKVIFQKIKESEESIEGQIVCLYRVTFKKGIDSNPSRTTWDKIYSDLCQSQGMPSSPVMVSCSREWDGAYEKWKTILDLKQ